MESIWTELHKPAWWVSTILAALVMNIVSAYVKEGLDMFTATISLRTRDRLRTQATERDHVVALLSQSPQLQYHTQLESIGALLEGAHCMVFSVMALILTVYFRVMYEHSDFGFYMQLFGLSMFSILVLVSLKYTSKGFSLRNIVRMARAGAGVPQL